ncbi:MAG: DUF1349 domain-containing protein, partial [Gammaproteobacteria bacterium]|nr:DUF1349 domain-containing protein [Gammaproteobacteria bacterium]
DERYPVYFVSHSLTGDGELIARLVSQEATGVAGLSLRGGTSLDDATVALVIDASDNNLNLYLRDNAGADISQRSVGTQAVLPNWLKLSRNGNSVKAYISNDGISWNQVDDVNVGFGETIEAGVSLAVIGSADQLTQFDSLSLTDATGESVVAEATEGGVSAASQTPPITIGGDISSDTDLLPDQAYGVTSDLVVNPGVTLTIPEGTILSFIAGTQLQVQGTLVIAGVDGNKALLTSAKSSPASGDWYGIVVQ